MQGIMFSGSWGLECGRLWVPLSCLHGVEPLGFTDGLEVGTRERNEPGMAAGFLAGGTEYVVRPFLKTESAEPGRGNQQFYLRCAKFGVQQEVTEPVQAK